MATGPNELFSTHMYQCQVFLAQEFAPSLVYSSDGKWMVAEYPNTRAVSSISFSLATTGVGRALAGTIVVRAGLERSSVFTRANIRSSRISIDTLGNLPASWLPPLERVSIFCLRWINSFNVPTSFSPPARFYRRPGVAVVLRRNFFPGVGEHCPY